MRDPSLRCRSRPRSVTSVARRCFGKTKARARHRPLLVSLRCPPQALAVTGADWFGFDRLVGVLCILVDMAGKIALDAVELAQIDIELIEGDLDFGRAQRLQDGRTQVGLDP